MSNIKLNNEDSSTTPTPSSGKTTVGIDQVTKRLYSLDDTGSIVNYGAGGGGSGGGIGIMGWDEGVPLGTGLVVNIVGEDIVMTKSGTVLQILHTNPAISFPQEVIGVFGQDEGVNLGTGTTLNVVGSNIALSISGTVLNLVHTDTPVTFPQEVIGVMGQDEGVNLGTGSILNITGDNIVMSLSGSVLNIAHTNPTLPVDQIGVLGRNQGVVLGTGTTIDWGLGMNAAITGSVLFVHPFAGGVNGQSWTRNTGTAQGTSWTDQDFNIQFHLGDGDNVVSTGATIAGYAYVEIPVDSIVESWTVLADATGSITTNILKSDYAAFPPVNPLAGLGQPILSDARKNTGNATGTASLSKGDILQIEVVSAQTIKLTTVSLQCRKNAVQ